MAEIRLKSTGTIKLFESDNTSSVTIASPASLGADRTITLPDADVTLVSGTMSTVALTGSTNNQVTTVTAANAITGETNLTFDGTDLTLGTGNVIMGTSGKGIDFSATGGGYGTDTSELFDDYEEGTWTPTMSNYGGTPTIADARYTKIGRMVFCGLQWTTDGTSDGSEAQINGLPYSSASLTAAGTMGGGLVTQTTGNAAQRWYLSAGANNAKACDGTGNSLNYNDIGANKDMRLYFTYEAT